MAVNVRVGGNSGVGQVTVSQQTRTTVAAQNFKPKPNVALTELTDLNISGVQDKQVIQYDSATGKFIANTVSATVTSVNGGAF
jgi:hypothetical protein